MTAFDRAVFKTRLKGRKGTIEALLGDRGGLEIERTADDIERALGRQEREREAEKLDSLSHELEDVNHALAKFTPSGLEILGDYGTCEVCGEEISHSRLSVIPQAKLCLIDQEMEEGNPRVQSRGRFMPGNGGWD